MKNTTKALIIIFSIILTIGSCRKTDYVPAPKIDLGTKSTNMKFNSPVTQIGENAVFTVSVTPGSKYSFQVVDINGDVKLTKGLTADESTEAITLDINKINSGAYDVIFIDTQGNEVKQPLIVK